MNYAKIANSPRLQRVDALLSDGEWHSTRDIVRGADVCAVNSAIAELRANGREIESRTQNRIWYYRKLPSQAALFAA